MSDGAHRFELDSRTAKRKRAAEQQEARDRETPILHRGVLYLDNPGILMSVHGRVLVLKINHQLHSLPRSVRIIVAGGRGFAITGAATKACIAGNIEVLISDDAATFVSLFVTEPRIDASRASLAVRCRQFAAILDPAKTAKIARAIVVMKVKAEGHAPPVKREFLTSLKTARTTDDVRHIEAKAAQVWWRQWAEFPMLFAGADVAADWHSWPGRAALGELAAQFTARDAIHPMQALHNYAIGILAARMTRVVIVRGLDACYGFLHDGRKPGRLSLVWDCIGPLRPELVRAVFGYAGGRVFRKDDFAVFEGCAPERASHSGDRRAYPCRRANPGMRQSGSMA